MSAAVAVEAEVTAQTLEISVRQLRALVEPVMPSAALASYDMPLLATVRIETCGKWLVAIATDRFIVAAQRLACSDGSWPAWSATIPTATVRNILTTFKPGIRGIDPAISLRVDGDSLRVTASDSLLDMVEASIVYPLQPGDYPKIAKVLRDGLAAEVGATAIAIDPTKMARLLSKASSTIKVKVSADNKPVVFTDGEDFFGLLMPRRLHESEFGDADWGKVFDALTGGKS